MTLETAFTEDEAGLDQAGGGWRDLLTPRYLASTIMLCLGVALFAFNEFFVSVALPSAIAELGKPWLLAWAFSLYLVFAILGGAMAAWLKGRFGPRTTLVVAAIIFLGGTALATLATHSSHLVVGRLLQGFGEGIIIALCYALIPVLFPKALVPKVFGSESIAWAAAAFGGPLIAGLLTQFISWRASFASSLPVGVIFILLVLVLVPRQSRDNDQSAPVPLLRLMMIGAGILAVSLCSVTEDRFAMAALLASAALAFWFFLRADRSSAHSILPRNAFSARALPGLGLWVILLMPLASSAGAVYLMYGVQGIWMLKPAEAGLLSALMALAWSFTGIGVASIASLDLRNRLIALGPILLALGTAGLVITMTADMLWLAYPSQVVIGVGYGISWGTLSQLLMDRSEPSDRDKTSALLPTLQSTGYAIGGATYGLIANISGLREGLDGEPLRQVLIPLFIVALGITLVSVIFGLRTVASSAPDAQQDIVPQN
jgi:MFS family permease